MDVIDTYHSGTLWPSQVRAFVYIIPSVADNDCIIICIDLVLPMVWVDSPKFFCAFSKTLAYMVNALEHTSLPSPGYGAIVKIPRTGPGPPHTLDSLTHKDNYMDDMITLLQGGPEQQHQVFNGNVWSLKWIFLSLPRKTKDSVSVKKIQSGEGNCTCVKEVPGWTINI